MSQNSKKYSLSYNNGKPLPWLKNIFGFASQMSQKKSKTHNNEKPSPRLKKILELDSQNGWK